MRACKNFSLFTIFMSLLVVACGDKNQDKATHAPSIPAPSLTDDAPTTFEEISLESLSSGKSFSVSDPNVHAQGWRFSSQKKGTLRVTDFSSTTSCDGDAQLSVVLRALDSKGVLGKDILLNLRDMSEYTAEPGSYAVVLTKSSNVKCSQFDVSFLLKFNAQPLFNTGDNNSPKIEFEGFSYIQELDLSPNAPDTGALFIVRANQGKIQQGTVKGPSFLKKVSVDTVTKENLDMLFNFSSFRPSAEWKNDILKKYEGGTLLYFRKYPIGLCNGEEHEVEFQFKDSADKPHTAIWQFIALRQSRAACNFVKAAFLNFSTATN